MNRILGGGLALGLATVGSIALAAPSLAEDDGLLEGQLSAEVVAPGATITASSVEPCTVEEGVPDTIYWAMGSYEEDGPRVTGSGPLDEAGHWEIEFTAPEDTGEFVVVAVCGEDLFGGGEVVDIEAADIPAEVIDEGGDDLPEIPGDDEELFEIYELFFTVEDGTTDTTVPAPVVAPVATPVVAQPSFTG